MRIDASRLAVGITALLATAGPVAAADQLAVLSFGGAYQDAQRKAFFEPYTASTGTRIVEQEYGGEIAKIRAMIETGAVTVNVVDVDGPTLQEGCDEGIYETLDWAKIAPREEWLAGTATDCGVGIIVYATVVAYDGAKLREGPTTIADLFDTRKFPGKRGLQKYPPGNLEFALLADGVPPDQVYATLSTPAGVDRAFRKLDSIKSDIVWWESGAQPAQLLASGEVVMTSAWNGRISDANKEGKAFQIVWDGQLLDTDSWAIPKGAANLDEVYKFIAYTVRPDVLAKFPAYIPYGPVRTTAASAMAPDLVAALPTAPAHMTRALTTSYTFWSDHGEELRRRFTTWLGQ